MNKNDLVVAHAWNKVYRERKFEVSTLMYVERVALKSHSDLQVHILK